VSGQKVLFLDRDGVINIDTGHPHVIEEIQYVDGIFDLCSAACTLDYKIIIVTNQAGIAKGYYDEKSFMAVMNWMLNVFKEHGVEILDVYYCPHHINGLGEYKKSCRRRKPEPGMILDASVEHDIDLNHSIIIGDKMSDMEAGRRAGVKHKFLYQPESDCSVRLIDGIQIFAHLSEITNFLQKKLR